MIRKMLLFLACFKIVFGTCMGKVAASEAGVSDGHINLSLDSELNYVNGMFIELIVYLMDLNFFNLKLCYSHS